MSQETIALIAGIFGGGAVFSFVQFMITFAFSRKDKQKEIENEIKAVRQEQKELRDEIKENAAILARTHILRFSDELRNGVKHSNEYFKQQLDDCDTYNRYCSNHPNFKNSYTETADQYIKETYKRLLQEGKL